MGMGITGDEEDKCAISFLGGMASILAFSAKVPKHLINEEINEFIHQLREVMLEDSKIDIFEDMP